VDAVIWQLVECGAYAEDLALWRELAAREAGPVLDLGAGIGRVSLDLADRGHEVVALDVEPALLDAIDDERVETVVGDARDFELGRVFPLILAPMQTVQLLGGADARASMLRAVRRHLQPGGLFAAALANAVDTFGDLDAPMPDMREVDGVVYSSRPVAVRDDGDGFVLERVRERVTAGGEREVTENAIRLERVTAETLAVEARREGFVAEEPRLIGETDDHVGSEVAMLRG
jgi:SAM-dependent methyltransferase